jgi:hypothetical protein
MCGNQLRSESKILICAMTLFPWVISVPVNAQEAQAKQVLTLGKIAEGILTCTAHPCIGDSEQEVRKGLSRKILSDEVSYYSDLGAAFPSARGVLSGIVEWDLETTLDMVSLKVTGFRARTEDLLAELEHALPGCQMERDDENELESGNGDDGEDHFTRAWSCSAQGYSSKDILVEVYFIPGLLLLAIGS